MRSVKYEFRRIFSDLFNNSANVGDLCNGMLIVVSLNFRETIENVLAEYGLLECFFRIYDRTNVWAQHIGTKQILMENRIIFNQLNPVLCVLVDDQPDNLVDAPCNVVEIRGPGGITMKHDYEIRIFFNIHMMN